VSYQAQLETLHCLICADDELPERLQLVLKARKDKGSDVLLLWCNARATLKGPVGSFELREVEGPDAQPGAMSAPLKLKELRAKAGLDARAGLPRYLQLAQGCCICRQWFKAGTTLAAVSVHVAHINLARCVPESGGKEDELPQACMWSYAPMRSQCALSLCVAGARTAAAG
jgi:hypothetical protein